MPPHSLPSCYYNPQKVVDESKKKTFCSSCFQTVITVHVCVCALLLPYDRDRWIGSHHIYQRKQFMVARRGRAGARLNSAFKSQSSIWAEPSRSSRLRNRFVRGDKPAWDKAAARGFVVQNQERWCRQPVGMPKNDLFHQSGSKSRAFLRLYI